MMTALRAALALLFVAVAGSLAAALDFPTLTGRVVDEAGILDAATRASLTQKLADLESKTTNQFVVVTLKSLQGTTIEDFGVQLGRTWKIGQKDKNNGVLLVVAPNERKVRIEVGYGLEGTLTDAVGRLIIENSILPRFRANDFPGGIRRGVDDIIQVLSGDAESWKSRTPAPSPTAPPKPQFRWWEPLIGLIFFGVFVLIVVSMVCTWLVVGRGILELFGLVPKMKKPTGIWWWIAAGAQATGSGSGGSRSSGSSSGGGFSGGGGSFGGGGASGSW